MPKRVLDVGNCVPDHGAIRSLLERTFGAEVVQAHGPEDTLAELKKGHFDLVLVNRKLDQDYSDGLDIIKSLKADPALAKTPVMLITNYENHQAVAIAAGAEPGFGKLSLNEPATIERLGKFLR
jgi:CheY-like chemotaxis protein